MFCTRAFVGFITYSLSYSLTYLLTYSLTLGSRDLLEKLTVFS